MLEVQEHPTVDLDAEALFKEARRRERRRRAALAALGLLVAGVVVVLVLLLARGGAGGNSVRTRQRVDGASSATSVVPLRQPAALAVSTVGVLYVVDPSRDQILRRLRDGRFAVLAGSGHVGFSGDGGPAAKAALRLTGSSGVAVGHGGTVYFTDSGNDRVRAVLPDGRIETVAGDGRHIPRNVNPPYLTGSRPALRAELQEPTGLAFGPGGKLYIAAQDVVALSRDGTLTYFAGGTKPGFSTQNELLDGYPVGLAFDAKGDMFVTTFPELMERTASGRILFLGDGLRSDGGLGTLGSSPEGAVYAAYGSAIGIIRRLVNPQPVSNGSVMSDRGVKRAVLPGRLDRVLGTRGNIQNGFGPSGLAIGGGGTIYTDTDRGYWSSVSALVEIRHGHVHVLWTSR